MRGSEARRVLVERLMVAELLARRGEGPLARRHYAVVRSPVADSVELPPPAPREPKEPG